MKRKAIKANKRRELTAKANKETIERLRREVSDLKSRLDRATCDPFTGLAVMAAMSHGSASIEVLSDSGVFGGIGVLVRGMLRMDHRNPIYCDSVLAEYCLHDARDAVNMIDHTIRGVCFKLKDAIANPRRGGL